MAGYIEVILLLPLLIVTSTRTTSGQPTSLLLRTLPPQGAWSFGSCFKATFGARLIIPYTHMDGKTSNLVIDVPTQAIPDSSQCNSRVSTILLRFFHDPNNFQQHWEFSITFSKPANSSKHNNKYKIENATVQYVIDDNFPLTAQHGGQWYRFSSANFDTKADVGSYISCNTVHYQLGTGGVSVSLFYAKIQPFASDVVDNGYGTRGPCLTYVEEDTQADSGPSKTAAAVSILLIIAVMVVIGGVLYTRRKRLSHGTIRYQRN